MGGAAGGGAPGCALSVTVGGRHTCAVRNDGTLWCWGQNEFGELGDGTKEDRPAPTLVAALGSVVAQVDGGWYSTCARKTDDTTWCWGRNHAGNLGIGALLPGDKTSPQQVTAVGASAAQVVAGDDASCARKGDGSLWCWGAYAGEGAAASEPSPIQVTALGNDVADVSIGVGVCARKVDHSLWCWGQNLWGQVGDGTETPRVSPVQVTALGNDVAQVDTGFESTCAVKTDGSVWCWGQNGFGEVGDGTTTERHAPVAVTALASGVAQVAVGNSHACARKTDGTVWCWGSNTWGNLGDGTTKERHAPLQVAGLTGATDVSVDRHSCARKTDGTIWCWGENDAGALGDGTTGGDFCGGNLRCRTRPVQVALPCP